jgi:serine/threonine protein phosphatase PrpC
MTSTSLSPGTNKRTCFAVASNVFRGTLVFMIKSSFGLSEIGAVRRENQDNYLLDIEHGIFAVADGLGGLPNGARASKLALEVLRKKLLLGKDRSLLEIVSEINEETRIVGFQLSPSGFGTTLTAGRLVDDNTSVEIVHVGDSAAYLVEKGQLTTITKEHTVAARMAEDMWQDASEAIPLSAHHTLTQCIGQELYIDPQIVKIPIRTGSRFFFLTDGVTKPIDGSKLRSFLLDAGSLNKIGQTLSFRIEAAGAPDNYTIVGVEFS